MDKDSKVGNADTASKTVDPTEPQLTMKTHDGVVYTMALSFWREFADGKITLAEIDNAEALLRVIVRQWVLGWDKVIEKKRQLAKPKPLIIVPHR